MGQGGTTAELEKEYETPSAGELLGRARSRLRSALEMLGDGDETTVLDEKVAGAGILAHDAGDVLASLFELRLAMSSPGEGEGSDG